MLYDNALLARAYLHGWQVTGDPLFRTVTEETLDWALREMRGPEGGFYSALDADSEGVEGKFYVWSLEELREALADEPDADEAIAWFGATERGNFEGRNIPVRGPGEPERRDEWRRHLYEVRAKRVWPGLDDKRLTSWNALMIAALADGRGARARGLPRRRPRGGRLRARRAARRRGPAAAHLEGRPRQAERLPRGPRLPPRGAAHLYEATFEPRWFAGRALADSMIERFADDERGGFFETSSDHERLVARRKDLEDHPDPGRQLERRLRPAAPGALTGEHEYEPRRVGPAASAPDRRQAPAGLRPPASGARLPAGHGEGGRARGPRAACARARGARLVPASPRARRRRARRRPAAGGPRAGRGRPTAYVCEHFACRAPVTEPVELEELLT